MASNGSNGVDVKQQVQETRAAVLAEFEKTPDAVDPKDLDLIKNDDWQVERFLIRKKHNVKDAIKMIVDTLKWRKELGTPSQTDLSFPSEFFKSGAIFRYTKDKQGNGTIWVRVRLNMKLKEMEKVTKQFLMHHINVVDRETDGRGMAVIFDCRGAGLSNLDMDMLWFMVSSLINYCPSGMNYILVYDMPWLLKSAWTIVKGWLPEDMRHWIKFAKGDEIYDYFTKETLPLYLGGTCKLDSHAVPEGCKSTVEMGPQYGISEKDALKSVKTLQPSLTIADEEIQLLKSSALVSAN